MMTPFSTFLALMATLLLCSVSALPSLSSTSKFQRRSRLPHPKRTFVPLTVESSALLALVHHSSLKPYSVPLAPQNQIQKRSLAAVPVTLHLAPSPSETAADYVAALASQTPEEMVKNPIAVPDSVTREMADNLIRYFTRTKEVAEAKKAKKTKVESRSQKGMEQKRRGGNWE